MKRRSALAMLMVSALLVVPFSGEAGGNAGRDEQRSRSDRNVREPVLGHPEHFAVSDKARSLPLARQWRPGRPERFVPLGSPKARPASASPSSGTDGGADGSAGVSPEAPAAADPIIPAERSFAGISFTGFRPPDTNGDVGPNHYVQTVNASFQVFNKAGGTVAGPSTINSLFAPLGAGSLCATTNRGDPVVLYDELADRWLISQFAFATDASNNAVPPFEECIAISQTANPAGAYFLYDFNVHNTKFPDYPKPAVWPVAVPGSAQGAYFMSTNQFGGTVPPDTFVGGGGAYAFNRTQMLAGNPAAPFLYFDTTERQMLPSDLDGATAPPAFTPNFFIKFVDDPANVNDRLEIRSFVANFTTPGLSTFTLTDTVPVAAFDSDMCGANSEQCIPQPPPSSCTDVNGNDMSGVNPGCSLAAIPDRLLHRAAYRNFGSFQTLVVNHTVDADGTDHAGVDWHELRNVGAGWVLQQEGVHSPDATHRWMGSIAMNGQQDIALGYSVSSGSVFPGIRFAGRQAADPAGTLQAELTLVNGTGSQTRCQRINDNMGNPAACRGRWGDYSAMSVDPVDDCTFWYTQQWMPVSGLWNTQIGAFRFESCLPSITINDVSRDEGNFGTTAFVFTLSLSGPSALPATVDFATADGTATVADGDYQSASGTVTFAPGDTSETVTVLVNGDVKVEVDETFFVNLSNASGATIADNQGQGTILNDDLSPDVACTITGTSAGDVIVGTAGDDVICAGNGHDDVNGAGGDDVIFGENGRDVLRGGDDNDLLLGGNGEDELRGGAGNDNLQGGDGTDLLVGGSGSDVLFGELGSDSLDTEDGVEGNDLADGGPSPDECATDPNDGRVSCP
jgi:hypothetical protein